MDTLEQEAIRRILNGDPDVYRILMDRHFPTVLRMTLRVTGSLEDAEEAAQEAFIRAYNRLATFREHATFGTWVYRIAMNCSLNLVERRTRDLAWNATPLDSSPHIQETLSSPHLTPEALLLEAEAARQREQMLQCLTPMERSAFILRHLEDQPVAVIAQALNIKPNTARQTIFRAATKLRRHLSPTPTAATYSSSQLVREAR
jgi:RNA polymerase sigma-70 factor (ECF subfamily)